MEAPDEPVLLLIDPYQVKAVESGAPQVEAFEPVPRQILSELLFQLSGRQPAPVLFSPVQWRFSSHDLDRSLQSLVEERSTEHPVPLYDARPCLLERVRVKRAFVCPAELFEILVRTGRVQGVEEQPLLHRGKAVYRLGLFPGRKLVDLGLGEPGEREIGRGMASGAGLHAMSGQFQQALAEFHRKSIGRLLAEMSRADRELDPEPAAVDQGVDLDRMRGRVRRRDGPAGAVSLDGAGQRTAGLEVRSPEVVERDLGGGPSFEKARPPITAHISQDAVAKSAIGYRAKLFLDRLYERRIKGVVLAARFCGRHFDADGIETGEPTRRACDVDRFIDALAPVSLEVEEEVVT